MLFTVLWILMTIIIEVLYHKAFRVTYFSSRAMGKELMTCMAIAFFLTGLILMPFV